MNPKITREVLEGHLRCKFKGHLLLAGQHGTCCDYEALLAEEGDRARREAIDRIVDRNRAERVLRGVPLSPATLNAGSAVILDATFEDEHLCLLFDGVQKVPGASLLGDFHYLPLLLHDPRPIRTEQKVLLEAFGLLLSRLQGIMPASGIIWQGGDRLTRIRLGPRREKAEYVLQELMRLRGSPKAPRLILNDHCQVCEFRQRCHNQAVQEDSISLLRGVGEKEVKTLGRKGILTVTQLAHMFRPRRKGKRQTRKAGRHFHALQAVAVRDKKIYVLGTPQLPASPVHVYLDVEGLPDEGYVYLIGMTVVVGETVEHISFWADSKAQEADIYEQFLARLSRHDNFLVFCYGSYEKTFLTRMRKYARQPDLAEKVLKGLVNVLSVIYAHIYFPCYSNGLKEVAGHLGCMWTDPDASGIQSIVWRMRWQQTRDDSWKHKLVAYNREDCEALRRVAALVQKAVTRAALPPAPMAADPETPSLGFVRDLDSVAQDHKWGVTNFANPDYEYINACAYFDYQRDRVFIRTSKTLRQRKAKPTAARNRRLRVTKRILILDTNCPFCKSEALSVVGPSEQVECRRPRVKKAFDLVITPSGIRRKVIECRTRVQRCLVCGKAFVPARHDRLDKHFHGLKSWAMYQHVVHGLSLGTVETMIVEFFGLRVFSPEVHMFKSLLARYYQETYRGLLDKILRGALVHIDETEVKLRTGKGYVWVFTSLEDVVFLYRPTREGDFLQELLKDFRGVLVSDFYAAYDALPCPQQKCLIHLMRDINQDLLNNPFDEELRSITGPFGTLLRAIVTTIDSHGLKRTHLKKHEREVEKFFRLLSGPPFSSEAAEALRKRLNKYREKLFAFLNYDGVPWNNNNAENAIKRFAYYREDTAGTMKETGVTDYLVLLSMCHTCRYKGVSFLKFLLSRLRDIDEFCERGKPRRQRDELELYPEGYIPPHFARFRPSARSEGPLNAVNPLAPDAPAAARPPDDETSRSSGTPTILERAREGGPFC